MATMSSSFFSISSSSSSSSLPFFPRTPPLLLLSLPHLKKGGVWGQGHVLLQVNCSKQTSNTDSSLESSSSPSSAITNGDEGDGDEAYKWCAALGGIGFLETAYLSYLKLTNSDAFCPMGAGGEGSCTTILTSDYSSLFGIPLPLFGMLAYGLVTTLGLQLEAKKRTTNTGKTDGEIILIGVTTSMAVASAYFLYILRTEFGGELCLYCLASAILSFTLFFITLKRHELQKILSLQLFIAGAVVIALTASYNDVQSVSSSMTETEIPYFETEIIKESSPSAISLAKHLRSIGAKLYGAFWCSHCLDQKELKCCWPYEVLSSTSYELGHPANELKLALASQGSPRDHLFTIYKKMFGREAAKMLDYVECFPDGVSKGTKMAQVCSDVKLEGFPSWEINGQVLSGEKQLSELAALSGIRLEDTSQSN